MSATTAILLTFGLPIIGGILVVLGINFKEDFDTFNKKYANSSGSHGKVTKLRWKTIKSLYKVNRWRWRYERIVSDDNDYYTSNCCLLYNAGEDWIHDTLGGDLIVLPYKNKDKIVRVQLSLIDYLKFHWAKAFAKEQDIGAELIMETAQRDIDKVRELAEKRIEESQKIMEDFLAKQKQETENKDITLSI